LAGGCYNTDVEQSLDYVKIEKDHVIKVYNTNNMWKFPVLFIP